MTNNNNNSPYDLNLETNGANHIALSPVNFIARTADIYPEHLAVIYQDVRRNWRETYQRCVKVASALAQLGIGKGDTVAAILPNIPEMLELHFAVPMLGAVLNAQNTRLDAETIAFTLEHSQAKVLFTDKEFAPLVKAALAICSAPPIVIDIDDAYVQGELLGIMTYDQLLVTGADDFAWQLPEDEWQAISLNYTSGTTGNPKGVVYHHRGAYLNALSNIMGQGLPQHAVYLWTLPMFHCNCGSRDSCLFASCEAGSNFLCNFCLSSDALLWRASCT
ncbi:AMP-binding enzyme [Oceanospirillum multiglobuliferum]|nr:AMP-binding enzyme [Oceanospirillum multiglobuliferum]